MRTVLQIEHRGDLAPYVYESEALRAAGAELKTVRTDDPEEVVGAGQEADVVWLEWAPHLTADVLRRLPRCRFVMRWGVGYDQIDVQAATSLGIAVANAPTYCTDDVAEHALALLLSVTRQVAVRHGQMRQGEWRTGRVPHRRLQGSTIGIVGLGRIGRRFAELALAFGATVIGADALPVEIPGVRQTSFEDVLRESDFLSLHVPLTEDTRHLINREALALMRPDAVLVNTSRGGVVEQESLIEALEGGRIAAAALDVFEEEPLPATSALRGLANVVLTPHEAASSKQSLADLRREMCATTVEWLNTGWAASIVNPAVRGAQADA